MTLRMCILWKVYNIRKFFYESQWIKDESEIFRFQLHDMVIFYTLMFIQFQLTQCFSIFTNSSKSFKTIHCIEYRSKYSNVCMKCTYNEYWSQH